MYRGCLYRSWHPGTLRKHADDFEALFLYALLHGVIINLCNGFITRRSYKSCDNVAFSKNRFVPQQCIIALKSVTSVLFVCLSVRVFFLSCFCVDV